MQSQVAVVQGGTRGLGLALAEGLLARGYTVFATGRAPSRSAGLTALAEAHPGRVHAVPLDLEDEASVARAAERVGAVAPRVHALWNVSGVLHGPDGLAPERKLASVTAENLQRVFAVNAFGPILVAKHFEALLRHEARAVVANLSARVGSISDNRLGGWYAYRASKAAQNQLTRTLALEMSRRARNVVVVALHPGTVDTELSAPFQRNVAKGKLFTPADSAERLLTVAEGLETADSGRFFAYDGQPIEW